MMRAPLVYQDGELSGLSKVAPAESLPYSGLLYATNRNPGPAIEDPENETLFYDSNSDGVVRVGIADIELVDSDLDWLEVRETSLSDEREDDLVIEVASVEELGVLTNTFHPFMSQTDKDQPVADSAFAELINAQLSVSGQQEILVYIGGYRAPFDSPVLVCTEFWHFLGYDGVAIAFAWPSTPSLWAYLRDIEAADNASREFRLFLEYLSDHTDAERINILSYSAGTRMVVESLQEISLKPADADLRIGRVILVGSDVSRAKIGALLADGVLEHIDTLAVYLSGRDQALQFTDWLFDRDRIGSIREDETPRPQSLAFLKAHPNVELIDVSDAEYASLGSGHHYFRDSPWTSSDIFASLEFDLAPRDRGLRLNPNNGRWEFPVDYPARLLSLLKIRTDSN
ncbi:MAG: alpha/beta hydrolase [Verrucomicrobiota bacterium]